MRHHHEIVGAIATGDNLLFFQAKFIGQFCQVMRLGGGVDNVTDDTAGQFATGNFQLVRGCKVEA